MNSLEIFKKDNFEIRVAKDDNNEPLFCLVDVCKVLGINDNTQVKDALKREFGKGVGMKYYPLETAGGIQQATFITEPQLYYVLMRSNKDNAKPFRLWVTTEVLPSIRKHGGYLTPDKVEEVLLNPDTLIQLATNLKNEQAKRKELEERIKENEPKVLFAKALESSKDTRLIGEFAKILNQNGIDIGQNRLFSWLREYGYLIKAGEQHNMPTQKSMDLELFEVKTTTHNNPDGSVRILRTTKITPKGQSYFINKLLKDR